MFVKAVHSIAYNNGHKRSAEIRSTNYQFKAKVNMKNKNINLKVGTRHFFYALLAVVLFSSCDNQ